MDRRQSAACSRTPAAPGAFTAPFFSDIILLFFGGFVISSALNQYLQNIGREPGFLTWMAVAVPLMIVMLFAAWGLLLVLFPTQTKSVGLDPKEMVTEPFSMQRWIVVLKALEDQGKPL